MSIEGIRKAAKVFEFMQETRNELISMGVRENDHTDILLGQMLENGKEAIVKRFEELTLFVDKQPKRKCKKCGVETTLTNERLCYDCLYGESH